MKLSRYLVLGLFALLLAVFAAGCGGDDGGGDAGGTGGGGGGTEEASEVSGTISVQAVWTGQEGESFQAVIDAFNEHHPDVTVNYKSAQDIATVLSTAVEGGNPPDVAALPNPGLMTDFASRGAIQPIDFARETIEENYSEDWINLGSVENQLYGVFFKGANKSSVWYNAQVFEDAGVEPATEWEQLLEDAKTINASGVPAYSVGGSEGWVLTDLFENIYLRTAGPEKYDQLVAHEIPWTDASVTQALEEMAKVLGDEQNLAGGTQGSLQTDFTGSVTQVFTDPPKGAMIFEGDFVGGVITNETQAQLGEQANVFKFPSIGGQGENFVVGAGDVVVMFKDSPAAQAFIEFLATPEAAEIWAGRGGFSSPNQNVSADVYPDDITRELATALAEAETFRFDASDLMPAAFGSDALFKGLQDFLGNPDNAQAVQQQLENQAKRAYRNQ
jgi:ABC-type glycerol-3-phosphate transport system substrate-binding protein